jgi:gas vesicle protein
MLQNATQTASTIDPVILTIVSLVIGGIIGIVGALVGAYYGFKKTKEWDIDKENRKKEEEFNRIKDNLISELSENEQIVSVNKMALRQDSMTIAYFRNDSWKLAQYSGLLTVFSDDVRKKLVEFYSAITTINQGIRQREQLTMSAIRANMGEIYKAHLKAFNNALNISIEVLEEHVLHNLIEDVKATNYIKEKKW